MDRLSSREMAARAFVFSQLTEMKGALDGCALR
jgi:hypothetical protein